MEVVQDLIESEIQESRARVVRSPRLAAMGVATLSGLMLLPLC